MDERLSGSFNSCVAPPEGLGCSALARDSGGGVWQG
jgi:hypothetical protein